MSEIEIERGRYRLTQHEGLPVILDGQRVDSGAGILTRAVDLCETCRNCGCGTKTQLVVLPAAVVKVLTGRQIEMHEIMGLATALPGGFLKGLTSRGPRSDGTESSGGGAEATQGRRAARRARRGVPAMGLPDQAGDSPADPASPAAAR